MPARHKIILSLLENEHIQVSTGPDTPEKSWYSVVEFFQRHAPYSTYDSPNRTLSFAWWDFVGMVQDVRAFSRISPELIFDYNTQALERLRKISQDIAKSNNPNKQLGSKEIATQLSGKGFLRDLTQHQMRNVAKLYSLPHGATFSVPGAGKTTEALASFILRRDDFKPALSTLLVICPKNAFPAWDEQVAACLGRQNWRTVRLIGGHQNIRRTLQEETRNTIFLITYQQLSSPGVTSLIASLLIQNPSAVFLDESHRIKRGPSGIWANAVLSISHLPQFKLVMSGTPIPNALTDLAPQARFLYPTFTEQAPDFLQQIQGVSVRTTKAELGLPEITHKKIEIPMTRDQARLYAILADRSARQLEASLTFRNRSALRKAAKSYQILLQAVTDPALLSGKLNSFDLPIVDAALASDSPKFAYACERARQLAGCGSKVLIWSYFVNNVETIARRLSDLNAVYIHGGVEARPIVAEGENEDQELDEWDTDWSQGDSSREEILNKFHNDPDCMVLVANPQACAEGISLHTVCHNAIYIDRNYQAASFLQSQDRIHRLGLPSDTITTLEYLVSPGTIDESVERRLNNKIDLMVSVLNDPSIRQETVVTPFEELADDIQDLLNTLKGNR